MKDLSCHYLPSELLFGANGHPLMQLLIHLRLQSRCDAFLAYIFWVNLIERHADFLNFRFLSLHGAEALTSSLVVRSAASLYKVLNVIISIVSASVRFDQRAVLLLCSAGSSSSVVTSPFQTVWTGELWQEFMVWSLAFNNVCELWGLCVICSVFLLSHQCRPSCKLWNITVRVICWQKKTKLENLNFGKLWFFFSVICVNFWELQWNTDVDASTLQHNYFQKRLPCSWNVVWVRARPVQFLLVLLRE